MKNIGDRQGSKLVFLFLFIIFLYLAFFGFDVQKAWDYTFSADSGFLGAVGL